MQKTGLKLILFASGANMNFVSLSPLLLVTYLKFLIIKYVIMYYVRSFVKYSLKPWKQNRKKSALYRVLILSYNQMLLCCGTFQDCCNNTMLNKGVRKIDKLKSSFHIGLPFDWHLDHMYPPPHPLALVLTQNCKQSN